MSKGPFLGAEDRPIGGCNCQALENEFFGYFLGVPSNSSSARGLGENLLHHARWKLPLHYNALWVEECRSHLSTNSYLDV